MSPGARGMASTRREVRCTPTGVRVGACAAALGLALLGASAPEAQAQSVLERSPNLSGGWVGVPGTVHFNFLHRFWLVEGGGDDKLVNSPTMLLAAPLPGNTLVGVQYASNSLVASGTFNEWEVFGRWAPLGGRESPVDLALTAGYNTAAESVDSEVALSVPAGPLRLLGSARYFTDALALGEPGWALGGGAVLRLRDGFALSADVTTLEIDGMWPGEGLVWGAGLQLQIPATPHTFSVQASNTRTGTLQGSSGSAVARRTVWGFEFTIPVVLARHIPALRSSPPAPAALRTGDEVEVTMNDALQFVPDTIWIREGQTVVWTNPTPVPHTVTADPDAVRDPDQVLLPQGAETFDSGNMFTGDEFRHTFTVPGEYRYVCVPHDMVGMVGTVIVEPADR
jgi:plastocyanin